MKQNNSTIVFGLFCVLPMVAADCKKQKRVTFSPDTRSKPLVIIEKKSRSYTPSPDNSFNCIEKELSPVASFSRQIEPVVKFISISSPPSDFRHKSRFGGRPPSPSQLALLYGKKYPETSPVALSVAVAYYEQQKEKKDEKGIRFGSDFSENRDPLQFSFEEEE
jgi:hypothetical protein